MAKKDENRDQANSKDLTQSRKEVRLDSLAAVRTEMARIYRLGLKGACPRQRMTSLVYVLREIRAVLETERLDDIERRMAELGEFLEGRGAR